MSTIRDGTAEGLLAFLEWMTTKGLVKAATGNSYKSAVVKVLEIEGDEWAATDIRSLEVEDQLARFQNISGHNYTPGSLNTYMGRFERAVEQYLDYLESPSSFKPSVSSRRRSKSNGQDNSPASTVEQTRPAEAASGAGHELSSPPASSGMIEHTFPLRSGETAYFRLPREFSSAEVDRMAGFLRALAFDPESAD